MPSDSSAAAATPSISPSLLPKGGEWLGEYPLLDHSVRPDSLFEDCRQVLSSLFPNIPPGWDLQQCKEGITNKLVKCVSPQLTVLVRAYGRRTELIIDRQRELLTFMIMSNRGLSPPLYGRFKNGFVYGWMEGRALTPPELGDSAIAPLIARRLAEWHRIELPEEAGERRPCLFPALRKWLKAIEAAETAKEAAENSMEAAENLKGAAENSKEAAGNSKEAAAENSKEAAVENGSLKEDGQAHENPFKHALHLSEEIAWLEEAISRLPNSPTVFCHNDLLAPNIVLLPSRDECCFIDFEYGAWNYRSFDIANHFCEWAGFDCDYTRYPTAEQQRTWLAAYGEMIDLGEIRLFSLAAHLFWSLWALLQAHLSDLSFDYREYARKRLAEYERLKGLTISS